MAMTMDPAILDQSPEQEQQSLEEVEDVEREEIHISSEDIDELEDFYLQQEVEWRMMEYGLQEKDENQLPTMEGGDDDDDGDESDNSASETLRMVTLSKHRESPPELVPGDNSLNNDDDSENDNQDDDKTPEVSVPPPAPPIRTPEEEELDRTKEEARQKILQQGRQEEEQAALYVQNRIKAMEEARKEAQEKERKKQELEEAARQEEQIRKERLMAIEAMEKKRRDRYKEKQTFLDEGETASDTNGVDHQTPAERLSSILGGGFIRLNPTTMFNVLRVTSYQELVAQRREKMEQSEDVEQEWTKEREKKEMDRLKAIQQMEEKRKKQKAARETRLENFGTDNKEATPGVALLKTATVPHPTDRKRLLLLIARFSFNLSQRANQERAKTMLTAKGLNYEIVDASDPESKLRCDALIELSGMKGKYPQLFIVDGDETEFLGDFNAILKMNEIGTLSESLLIKDHTDGKARRQLQEQQEERSQKSQNSGSIVPTAPTAENPDHTIDGAKSMKESQAEDPVETNLKPEDTKEEEREDTPSTESQGVEHPAQASSERTTSVETEPETILGNMRVRLANGFTSPKKTNKTDTEAVVPKLRSLWSSTAGQPGPIAAPGVYEPDKTQPNDISVSSGAPMEKATSKQQTSEDDKVAQNRIEEEMRLRAEAESKLQAELNARRQLEAELLRLRSEEKKRQQAEEMALKKAQEEASFREAEAAKLRGLEQALVVANAELARQQALLEETRKNEELDTIRVRAYQEAREQAELEARRKMEMEEKKRREAEARRKTEEKARMIAEAELEELKAKLLEQAAASWEKSMTPELAQEETNRMKQIEELELLRAAELAATERARKEATLRAEEASRRLALEQAHRETQEELARLRRLLEQGSSKMTERASMPIDGGALNKKKKKNIAAQSPKQSERHLASQEPSDQVHPAGKAEQQAARGEGIVPASQPSANITSQHSPPKRISSNQAKKDKKVSNSKSIPSLRPPGQDNVDSPARGQVVQLQTNPIASDSSDNPTLSREGRSKEKNSVQTGSSSPIQRLKPAAKTEMTGVGGISDVNPDVGGVRSKLSPENQTHPVGQNGNPPLERNEGSQVPETGMALPSPNRRADQSSNNAAKKQRMQEATEKLRSMKEMLRLLKQQKAIAASQKTDLQVSSKKSPQVPAKEKLKVPNPTENDDKAARLEAMQRKLASLKAKKERKVKQVA